MLNTDIIKGIIFDYGGTIDSNGLHWAEVIWQAYEAERVPVSKEVFREAYVHGERTLGKNPIIQPHHNFLDMLRLKCEIQFGWLKEHGHLSETSPIDPHQVAAHCYAFARSSIDIARPLLEDLAKRYPMVLVSNFYGNIETVLKDFGLDHLFGAIVESAVVGIRKPNPAIFGLGVERLGMAAENVVVVGDSYDKDIIPSQSLGCQTIWLKNIGWAAYKGDESADAIIADFTEMRPLFHL